MLNNDKIIHMLFQSSNLVISGPACSETAEPLAGVATHFKTVVISYSAEGSSFSDREKYPYFFRTIGENKQYQFVYLALFQHLGWKRVASLTEEGQKYAEYVSHLQDLLQEHKIAFVANRKFPKDRLALNMSQYLQDLKVLTL
jgi:ABC-type branched-subunit amino acid transport system substrate-binding protein